MTPEEQRLLRIESAISSIDDNISLLCKWLIHLEQRIKDLEGITDEEEESLQQQLNEWEAQ